MCEVNLVQLVVLEEIAVILGEPALVDVAGAVVSAGGDLYRRGLVGHVHHHNLATRALVAVGVDADLLAAVLCIRAVVDHTGCIVGVCAASAAGEGGGAGTA